ncbi:MAG TPA: flavin reductase family protein [Steroidobacteraceae bacterium]|nr:flavin reductase family protein [Steroidobacteraceae bacterium]
MSTALGKPELRDSFIQAMRGVATSVSVVATDGPFGRFGVTVSAVASVSADPPMVLVCIHRRSPAVRAIEKNGSLTINLLSSEQSSIADVFAGLASARTPFDFACAQWSDNGVAGAQHLENAAASLHASVEAVHQYGTHAVIIARVLAARSTDIEPLVYVRRSYGRVAQHPLLDGVWFE